MSLQDKYKAVIDTANANGVNNLVIGENNGVLHIQGQAPNSKVKDQLWDVYGSIDPNYLTGDLVMNIDVAGAVIGGKLRVNTDSSNLNIRKGPATEQEVIGKAAKGELVTLVARTNDEWWFVRTDAGTEGYCYAQYLTPAE